MPKKRVLSDFLCRELLYDYVQGRLDQERTKAVEECLAESEDVRDDLRALKEGIKYSQALRSTQISQPFLSDLQKPPKGFQDYLDAWKKLPMPLRLSVESLVVVVFVGATVISIPKEYLPWNKPAAYTLVDITREKANQNDEENGQSSVTTTTTLQVAQNVETTAKEGVPYGPSTTLQPILPTSVFNMYSNQNQDQSSPAPTKQPTVSTTTTTLIAKKEVRPKGEIFRVYMNAKNVDEISPQMAQKILTLGGEKAGEVELGWRRAQGRYFHFTLPETNLEELKAFMQNFGPVRIVKEPHGRVMPQGTIRLILWLQTTTTIEKNENTESQEQEEESH